MSRLIRIIPGLALLLALYGSLPSTPVWAQAEATSTPNSSEGEGPLVPKIHTIQAGETLTTIAALYEVTVDEILLINNLSNADAIFAGQELVIPGAQGDRIPAFYTIQVGDTVSSIAASFNTPAEDIVALNRLVSTRLVAGQRLGLLSGSGSTEPLGLTGRFHVASLNDTLLSVAMQYDLRPDVLADANGLRYPETIFPGQRLLIPDDSVAYQPLSGYWQQVAIGPLPLAQGESVKILVSSVLDGEPTGRLGEHQLRFSQTASGWLAVVGIDPVRPTASMIWNWLAVAADPGPGCARRFW